MSNNYYYLIEMFIFYQPPEQEEGEVKFEWQRGAPREAYVTTYGFKICTS